MAQEHGKFIRHARSFTAIDFETANYHRNSACQLGIAVVESGKIIESLSWLIKPPSPIFTFTYLHGIDYGMVRHQPTFSELWHRIEPYIANQVIAAHNATFDVSVLVAALNHYNIAVPQFQVIDSLTVARRTWPELPNHKLDTVAKKVCCDLRHHDAKSDALACAHIILQAEQEAYSSSEA